MFNLSTELLYVLPPSPLKIDRYIETVYKGAQFAFENTHCVSAMCCIKVSPTHTHTQACSPIWWSSTIVLRNVLY